MTLTRAPQTGRHPARVAPADTRWPIELLWAAEREPATGGLRGGVLPPELYARYQARLEIPLRDDRPTLITNFVSTLDGVVALDRHGATGGREISGGFEPDRFVMGLLRATADAVVVGAGTVRASRTHGWTPRHAHPASADAFAAWRRLLGLDRPAPATVIVTASGALEPRYIPGPDSDVIVVTTASGARNLGDVPRGSHLEVVPVRGTDSIPAHTLLAFLESRGFRVVLSEGGPTLFGELLAARLVDEVFLTVAPQLAGHGSAADRLNLVEGAALTPGTSWAGLRSVLRSNDHLFLRYQLSSPPRKDLS
jgi:riboflavin biosynthesis pyrimidine reductase